MPDIRILKKTTWKEANDFEKIAFIAFKNSLVHDGEQECRFINKDYDINVNRQTTYDGIYLTDNKTEMSYPIADWDDVKIFKADMVKSVWNPAKDYQVWAYFDFIYSDEQNRIYKSKDLKIKKYITVPIKNLEKNLLFTIGRNNESSENDTFGNSIYCKTVTTDVRICDNEEAREHYTDVFTRSLNKCLENIDD
jgi:hypothetical protein